MALRYTLTLTIPLVVAIVITPGPTSAQPAPDVTADALILPLPQVQAIDGNDAELSSDPNFDLHAPYTGMHRNDGTYPVSCRVIFDQDTLFTPGWTQFRTVQYSGSANHAVTQAVGIYPTPDAAQAVLDNAAAQLSQCADANIPDLPFTLGRPDNSTVARCSNGVCNHLLRATGATVISVDTVHLGHDQLVADTVLDAITAKMAQ